jgi:L-fuculose-phosphate aldolase
VFSETTDLIVSHERGKAVADCMGKGNVVILRNHGIVTAGRTIEEAVFLAIKLEKACRIQMLAEAPGRESAHGNAGFDPQRAALEKSKS